jgi:hypothetical protein
VPASPRQSPISNHTFRATGITNFLETVARSNTPQDMDCASKPADDPPDAETSSSLPPSLPWAVIREFRHINA